jgi:hypothetical protein
MKNILNGLYGSLDQNLITKSTNSDVYQKNLTWGLKLVIKMFNYNKLFPDAPKHFSDSRLFRIINLWQNCFHEITWLPSFSALRVSAIG